jgi:hypothetical protein
VVEQAAQAKGPKAAAWARCVLLDASKKQMSGAAVEN